VSQPGISPEAERLLRIEWKLERLALTNQALWEVLRERVGVTEAEVLRKRLEIDERDNVISQTIGPMSVTCPKCGLVNSSRDYACKKCGDAVRGPHLFEL
jgi:hypothetical protein